jgi:hypothetical protein
MLNDTIFKKDKKISFIHCIEKKSSHRFEEESRIYLNSLKRTNSKLIDEIDIHFLQPTHNDISKDCVINKKILR